MEKKDIFSQEDKIPRKCTSIRVQLNVPPFCDKIVNSSFGSLNVHRSYRSPDKTQVESVQLVKTWI